MHGTTRDCYSPRVWGLACGLPGGAKKIDMSWSRGAPVGATLSGLPAAHHQQGYYGGPADAADDEASSPHAPTWSLSSLRVGRAAIHPSLPS